MAFMQELWVAPEFEEYLTCSIQCFPDLESLFPILYAWGDPWWFEVERMDPPLVGTFMPHGYSSASLA